MSSVFPHAERTLPLTVCNTAFLLDRLGQDCHPLQYLRELTQNAIEAILRTPDKIGEVVWDVEWTRYELTGVRKLCVADTGDGMTGAEMVRYINQLSSSVAAQSITGNYGVGAKIAAATKNPAGLIYLSWKARRGSMIHLWRDPLNHQYGLRQFARPDGTFDHYVEIEDTLRPAPVSSHGTLVVLEGSDDDEDTMQAPMGVQAPSRWISRYLNTRYFRFPIGITVKAREGWEHPRSDKDRNVLRTIVGQGQYLEQHSESSGNKQLTRATAHWWILKDEPALSQNSGFIESSGHMAALSGDELYETVTGRAGRARLQQFGVLFGHNRVVIYLEPHANDVITNTPRTQLLVGGEPLPWAEWAAEFREDLPRDIRALVEKTAAGASDVDHSATIRDRLKQILDLFKVSRYRPVVNGNLNVDEGTKAGGEPRSTNAQVSAAVNGSDRRSGRRGGAAGGLYSIFLKTDGPLGKQVKADVFPRVEWVSVQSGKRQPGDIEDRAARFLLDQNVLFINADFRGFTDMVSRWSQQFDDHPAVLNTVEDVAHAWFEQALTETVLGVQALKDAREWPRSELEKALSEEALTAAVMQRYHIHNAIRRDLVSKLGKLHQTA